MSSIFKKMRMSFEPIVEVVATNNPGENALFFKQLFEALNRDPSFNRNEELNRLVKVHGASNGVDAKLGIHTFLTRVFSPTPPRNEREAKQLILKLYLYCDLIETDATFNALKGRITDKCPPSLLPFLNKLQFSDSPHKRLLISLFEDPDQSQFHLDFERTDFVNKEGFKPLVNSLFEEDPKLRKPFLNFFHQGAKTYSFNKMIQHRELGEYVMKEGTFFLREANNKLHFGFTQKARIGEKIFTHHLEFTFKSEGKNLIDRLEDSKETLS